MDQPELPADEPQALPLGTILGAIDIGSNSLKMTVGRLRADGSLEELAWRSDVVRLGAGLAQTGELAPDRIAAAVETLRRFREEATALGAVGTVAVATEATRAARNGDELLSRAAREAGVAILIIDGDREAALSFRGLAAVADISGNVIVADIGGGSTELIASEAGELRRAGSVPVGSGRLTDQFIANDPPRPEELAAGRESAARDLTALRDQVRPDAVADLRLILVGGTGEYLGRLSPDSPRLTPNDIEAALQLATVTPAASLAERLAIPLARAEVLPAGFAIVAAVSDLTTPATITIGQSGIRAGILLDVLSGRWPM